jgi:endonuclease/exonuclease/phosphatase family metal-dependent hydrolase
VATFNIQVLGESKAGKPHVMKVLADVVRRFDVVAIQELRTTNDAVMEHFLALINAQGGTYRYVLGPRLGRTVSKEQYVYIFDAARVVIDPQSVLTVSDPGDYLHREPLIARFQVRTSPPEAGFSFILVNIHTDPDETDQELDALDDVFAAVQRNGWREDDVILLGDLNVDSRKLGQLGHLPGITWIVDGQATNTRGTKSYDNILFDQTATLEFTGQAGILNLLETYGLRLDQALEVSDHMPVWAEFDVFERSARMNVATLPASSPPTAPGMAPPAATAPASANGDQDGTLRSRLLPRRQ